VGAEGDDRLHGFRGDNGQELYGGSSSGDGVSGLRHFVTILVAGGHFYIAGDGRIFAFHGDIGSHASQATIWPLPSGSMILHGWSMPMLRCSVGVK
jgi:hypothetical protein